MSQESKEETTRNINLTAVKNFMDRLVHEDTVDEVREGAALAIQLKDKFMAVICRVMGWSDWEATDDAGSRSVPDPIIDAAIQEIDAHPEKYFAPPTT